MCIVIHYTFLRRFFILKALYNIFFLTVCRIYANFNRGLEVDIIYEPTFSRAHLCVCVGSLRCNPVGSTMPD